MSGLLRAAEDLARDLADPKHERYAAGRSAAVIARAALLMPHLIRALRSQQADEAVARLSAITLDEARRILSHGTDAEVSALLRHPKYPPDGLTYDDANGRIMKRTGESYDYSASSYGLASSEEQAARDTDDE